MRVRIISCCFFQSVAVAISPGSFQHFTIFVIELMEVRKDHKVFAQLLCCELFTTQQMSISRVHKDGVDLIVPHLFTGKQGVVQAVRHLERRV